MATCKSLETTSAMPLNRLRPRLATKSVTNESDVRKLSRDLPWLDKLRFSFQRFFLQSASENNHLLCYWPTFQNSISKIFLTFLLERVKRKIFELKLCRMWQYVSIKGLRSRIMVYLVFDLNMMDTIMAFILCIIFRDRKVGLNPLIFPFRLNQLLNCFTKTFIRNWRTWILLLSADSRIDFRHDHCK